MMLRLVLVGMVAALGVTIPSRPDGHDWLGSAERWANSVLADWDTWRPGDSANGHERIAASVHECEQCRLARAALASRDRSAAGDGASLSTKSAAAGTAAVTQKPAGDPDHPLAAKSARSSTIAFEPIEVGDDDYNGIAYELNRKAEGIDLAQPPAPPVTIVARPAPVADAESFELDQADLLCGTMDEDLVDLPSLPGAVEPRRENEPTARDILVSTEDGEDVDAGETASDPTTSWPVAPPDVATSVPAPLAADDSEWFELIACQKGPFNEDDAPPYVEGLSMPSVAESPTLSAVTQAPAPPSPPVALPVVTQSVTQSQDQAADVPWPVFAPAETTTEPPTRVVQETTSIPGPVSAVEAASATALPLSKSPLPPRPGVVRRRKPIGAKLST